MERTQHTPGPWIYDAGDKLNDRRAFGIIAHDDAEGADGDATQCVAEVCEGDTAEADARLIAASPDLLLVCEMVLAYLEANRPTGDIRKNFHVFNEHENGVIKPLRAAIAKAIGQ